MGKRYGIRFHYANEYTFDYQVGDETAAEQLAGWFASAIADKATSVALTTTNMPVSAVIGLDDCVRIERIETVGTTEIVEVIWEKS